MKNLLLFVFALVLAVSCNKQIEKPNPVKNAADLYRVYKIKLPFVDYGDDEISVAKGGNGNGNSGGKNKPSAQSVIVNVWLNDLIYDGATTTISEFAEWAGVQRFSNEALNEDGVSICNWNWSYAPAPSSMPCSASGTGWFRSWTSDKKQIIGADTVYQVHISNKIQL